MLLRLILAASLLLSACTSRPRRRARPARTRSDAVEGCDHRRLRRVIEALGARRHSSSAGPRMFTGRVPIALVSTRVERCVVGEPVATCRTRFERPGRRVSIEAQTELRFMMEPMEPGDAFERRLAAQIEGDPRLELGRRVRVRVLREAVVCVREQELRRVRVEQSLAHGADLLALLAARAENPLVVISLPTASGLEPDGFSVRCAARDEMKELPSLRPDGPCSRFARRTVSATP